MPSCSKTTLSTLGPERKLILPPETVTRSPSQGPGKKLANQRAYHRFVIAKFHPDDRADIRITLASEIYLPIDQPL
ncbi:MAG: hypothetical protein G8D61_02860 [gamma proteobacterium symbiont of Ctena orbiculata]